MWFAVVTACTPVGVLMIIEWGSPVVDPSEEHLWMRQQLLKLTTFMQELATKQNLWHKLWIYKSAYTNK